MLQNGRLAAVGYSPALGIEVVQELPGVGALAARASSG
jgi:hypothetical protein